MKNINANVANLAPVRQTATMAVSKACPISSYLGVEW